VVDEGTVHGAYVLFLNGDRDWDPGDAAEYARLAPKPDLVVHVQAPFETVMARSVARRDRPMHSADPAKIRRIFGRASALFDALITSKPLASLRLIEYDGNRPTSATLRAATSSILAVADQASPC
jgi:deoxyadenosine/deoxycytidine kinase